MESSHKWILVVNSCQYGKRLLIALVCRPHSIEKVLKTFQHICTSVGIRKRKIPSNALRLRTVEAMKSARYRKI